MSSLFGISPLPKKLLPPLNFLPWKDPSGSTVPFTRYTPLQQPHWKSFTPLFRLTCIFTHIWRSSPPPMSYRERYPPSSTVLFIGYTPLQCPHWKGLPHVSFIRYFQLQNKKVTLIKCPNMKSDLLGSIVPFNGYLIPPTQKLPQYNVYCKNSK